MSEITSQPKSKLREVFESFPIYQTIFLAVFGIISAWVTVTMTQGYQAEKILKLEKESVSRELFDERTKAILDEQKRQRDLLEKILERKNVR